MKIAVVSDNPFLVSTFMAMIKGRSDISVSWFYSSVNRSPAELVTLGCTPLNLKRQAQEISEQFGIVLSLHCKQIFPPALVKAVRCYNLHPGLNPNNRGWFPQVFSIINKLPAGATLHEIDEHIDHGAIIDQEPISITPDDTSLSAYEKIMQAEVAILKRSLDKLIANDYVISTPQEGNYNSISDYRALQELDLNADVKLGQAIDLLRALTHPPYRNAWFVDPKSGEKYFVELKITKASDDTTKSS
jgi:methionyl-tRNA formyltransferase